MGQISGAFRSREWHVQGRQQQKALEEIGRNKRSAVGGKIRSLEVTRGGDAHGYLSIVLI